MQVARIGRVALSAGTGGCHRDGESQHSDAQWLHLDLLIVEKTAFLACRVVESI